MQPTQRHHRNITPTTNLCFLTLYMIMTTIFVMSIMFERFWWLWRISIIPPHPQPHPLLTCPIFCLTNVTLHKLPHNTPTISLLHKHHNLQNVLQTSHNTCCTHLNDKYPKHHGCRAPLHEEYPKHHGHKGDPRVTPGTSGAVGERAQVVLVWLTTLGVGNASHP